MHTLTGLNLEHKLVLLSTPLLPSVTGGFSNSSLYSPKK